MTNAILSLLLAFQTQVPAKQTAPSLVLTPDALVISFNGKEHREPLTVQTVAEDLRTNYRKDETSVWWDSKGLHVKSGAYDSVSLLEDCALSPKLSEKAQIIKNRDLISSGKRQKAANGLVGSLRLGKFAYFVPRWTDTTGKVWLEALVAVNLDDKKPKWKLLGKFTGHSLSKSAVENRLFTHGSNICMFASQTSGAWGLASYDPTKEKFEFRELGQNLEDYLSIGGKVFMIAEATSYGKTKLSRYDLATGNRRDLMEAKGDILLVDDNKPYLVEIQTNLGPALRNLETGCQLSIPARSAIRRTPFGVLVWPVDEPKQAALYSVERYVRLAVVTN
ncbi:MAG: hypothetical protein ABL949_11565 [Fimbriimonadaceae bacterium]